MTDRSEIEALAQRVANLVVDDGFDEDGERGRRDAIAHDLRELAGRLSAPAVPEGWVLFGYVTNGRIYTPEEATDYAKAIGVAVYAKINGAAPAPEGEKSWRHAANEWADVATNGPTILRNVRDGLVSADEGIADMEAGFARARAAQPAPESPEAASINSASKYSNNCFDGVAPEAGLRDAYEGAREDLLDWKGRAQRAEAELRRLGYKGIDASEKPEAGQREAVLVSPTPVVEMSPEFTDSARAAIAWVLYHHQGGSSPIGQPLRFALGMGAHERLPEWRIAEAQRWAAIVGATTDEFHPGRAQHEPERAVVKQDLTTGQREGVEALTDERIRAEWRAAGGDIHGPNVETVTMPEASYIAFRRRLASAQRPAQAMAYGIIDPDYARIFTIARCLAWAEGYALTMHGSFTRDLDLVAVPWTDHACAPDKLAGRIIDAAGLREKVDNPGRKPHGRLVWTLHLPGFGEPRWVDLSIMPKTDARGDGE